MSQKYHLFIIIKSKLGKNSTFQVQKKTSKKYIYSLLVEPGTPQRGKTGRSKKEKTLLKKKERQKRVLIKKQKEKGRKTWWYVLGL